VTIIRFTKNFGQNGATLCGIDQAKYNYVITMDDDMETPPKEIGKLIERYLEEKPDVIFGMPAKAKISAVRRIGGNGLKKFFGLFESGTSIGSSFRMISPWIVNHVRNHSHDHLFINQVISWYTTDIAAVETESLKRTEGKSGYSFTRLLMIGFRLIFHYTSFPLKALIFTGFLIATTCFVIGSYYIYRKVAFGALGGYTSLIVSIFFTTGMILAGMSVLGIYVKRIYDSRIKKPNYLVKIKL
jgi:glycosyltransferase involved in cell wall biosynthesis